MDAAGHQATLRFTDGVEHKFLVDPNEDLLEAALRQNTPLLHQCKSGSCGSCVARLASGDASMRKDVAASLLKSEQEEGFRLSCVTQLSSDCVFDYDYASNTAANGPVAAQAFVDSITWVASDVVKLKLELAEDSWMDFSPGQFAQLRVPGSDQHRRYSMSSTPQDVPVLEFLIRVLPNGLMSDFLREGIKVEDVIDVEGPFGSFFWREESKKPHIMIAGGTGIAPMMSMLDVIRQCSGKKPNVLLSFGCVNEQALFHLEELELRELWMPTLEARICIDKGDDGGAFRVGNPVQAIEQADVCSETVAYICGPPGMIAAAYSHLQSLGVDANNIHAEQFVASE